MNKNQKSARIIVYSLFVLIFLVLVLYFGLRLFGFSKL